jgi:hypothetical protein
MERKYKVYRWNGLRWYDIGTKFHDNKFRHLSNITVIITKIWEDVMLVLVMGRCMNYAV